MGKYLDKTGLSRLWSKIKSKFCPKDEEFEWIGNNGAERGHIVFTDFNGDLTPMHPTEDFYVQVSAADSASSATIGLSTGGGAIISLVHKKNGGYTEVFRVDNQGLTLNLGKYAEEAGLYFIISGQKMKFEPQNAEQYGILVKA